MTGKTIALTIQAFVGKMMSLLFNKLSSSHSFSYTSHRKEALFPGKDGRDGKQRKAQAVPSRHIILPTNARPIKGQFSFLTCYQVNFNSDNYSSWKLGSLLPEH